HRRAEQLAVQDLAEADRLPSVEARIYNVTDSGATFGALEPMMLPAEWIGLDGSDQFRGLTVSSQFQTRVARGGEGLSIPPLTPGMRPTAATSGGSSTSTPTR